MSAWGCDSPGRLDLLDQLTLLGVLLLTSTHYSAPELKELLDAVERVSDPPAQGQGLVLLRGSARA